MEGIYRLVYAGVGYASGGVFVFRNGAFNGVGQLGALYHGTYRFDATRNLYQFEGLAQHPPNLPTTTGYISGDQGATFKIKGELSAPNPSTRFSLDLGGRPVDVAMHFVCPIPGEP